MANMLFLLLAVKEFFTAVLTFILHTCYQFKALTHRQVFTKFEKVQSPSHKFYSFILIYSYDML